MISLFDSMGKHFIINENDYINDITKLKDANKLTFPCIIFIEENSLIMINEFLDPIWEISNNILIHSESKEVFNIHPIFKKFNIFMGVIGKLSLEPDMIKYLNDCLIEIIRLNFESVNQGIKESYGLPIDSNPSSNNNQVTIH